MSVAVSYLDNRPENHRQLLGVIIHEITHALGFTVGKFRQGDFACSFFSYLLVQLFILVLLLSVSNLISKDSSNGKATTTTNSIKSTAIIS
jgi:hypothetical protein